MADIQASKLRDKAEHMLQGMALLNEDPNSYRSGIGLLAVHSAMLFMDTIRAEMGERNDGFDSHMQSVRMFEKICKRKGDYAGIKHVRWLVERKDEIAYKSKRIDDFELSAAVDHAKKFSTWAYKSYLKEMHEAEEDTE